LFRSLFSLLIVCLFVANFFGLLFAFYWFSIYLTYILSIFFQYSMPVSSRRCLTSFLNWNVCCWTFSFTVSFVQSLLYLWSSIVAGLFFIVGLVFAGMLVSSSSKGFGDLGHLPLSNNCRTMFGGICFWFLSEMNEFLGSFESAWYVLVWEGCISDFRLGK